MDTNIKSTNDSSDNVENQKNERPSDIRKRAKHYQESRNEWKQRNADKRIQLQVLITKNTRLENRLDEHRDNIKSLERELIEAKKQLEALAQENKVKDEKIEDLKKKLKC